MVRQGTLLTALLACGLLAAPATAGAQSCEVPKAWQTAAAQLEYDLSLELGLTAQHTRHLLSQPSGSLPAAAVTYAGQRVTSAGYLASALARFTTTVAASPPQCPARRR